MTRPFVVGIPTYNRYDLLPRCIHRLMSGTAKPTKVYVIDNGGKLGGTEQLAMTLGYNVAEVITPQRNMGVGPSWNLLLRLTRPTTLILVNDDVFVGMNTLETLMRHEGPCIATAIGWSCFRHDHTAWDIIGDYDEFIFPAYLDDNDMDWRRGLAGVHRDICENDTDQIEHSPSSTLAAMTAEEQAWLRQNHAVNSAYYRLKWGGMPKNSHDPSSGEKFTKPFNGAGPEAVAELIRNLHAPERFGFPRILVGGQSRG